MIMENTMQKLLLAGAFGLALAGCSSLDKTQTIFVDGKPVSATIKSISSFDVEISPNKAVCTLKDTQGNDIQGECLQYRRTYEQNYNLLSGDIKGFTYETGNRYLIKVNQTPLADNAGNVVSQWELVEVLSKTPEQH